MERKKGIRERGVGTGEDIYRGLIFRLELKGLF
jgi:hypothetical protein